MGCLKSQTPGQTLPLIMDSQCSTGSSTPGTNSKRDYEGSCEKPEARCGSHVFNFCLHTLENSVLNGLIQLQGGLGSVVAQYAQKEIGLN